MSAVDKLTEAVEHVARTEDLGVASPWEEEAEDSIGASLRSFNSMTSALASSRDLQQQLIADAGHELRTPLTSLRTNIELLTQRGHRAAAASRRPQGAARLGEGADDGAGRAESGDLQELSRPDPGHQAGRVEIVAWQDVVEAALRRARLRGPELTVTADLRPWYAGPTAALERAVVNVLDNAVKFFSLLAGDTVRVRLADGVLTVRDHGPGIAADELPRPLFDCFWRSPGARALPGSGLGLSIVARTVQQAGGTVALTPAEGGGTTAAIRLPGAPTPLPGLPAPRDTLGRMANPPDGLPVYRVLTWSTTPPSAGGSARRWRWGTGCTRAGRDLPERGSG
ncbi:histidine kinase OS=Streptomyces albaduncus OX=68172 GN=FHS32_006889 PE=4 SV=1 [Streptomyces griseoloalbus]